VPERFGYAGGSAAPSAFPKARVVTLTESGTHASIGAAIGPVSGKGSGERSLARQLYPCLEEDQLLLADRNFYSFTDWCQAADTGAALLWRVAATLTLPLLQTLPDGSYHSVVISPEVKSTARIRLIEAARRGEELDPDQARYVRVVEYEVPDRGVDADRELICLITTLTDLAGSPAPDLAQAYHQRWEHEQANDQIKTHLRGPSRILRSKSPDLVQQEIYGYLLTHYAITALISQAATADVDPDRVKFKRTVRIIRRQVTADPAAFPPEHIQDAIDRISTDITRRKNLNPPRRQRSYPRVVKRARHNVYRIKCEQDTGTRHTSQPTIALANLQDLQPAA
jgi:hypothetical protein